jgi:putative membrane protein
MVSWFAVLFYLPRLFVYHAEHAHKSDFVEVVKIMEYKIYMYIGVPAFWATLLSGLLLIYLYPTNIFTTGGWFHTKLLFVVVLIAYFFSLGWFRTKMAQNSAFRTGKFFRIYNEVPTILMLIIVAMVIVKPF